MAEPIESQPVKPKKRVASGLYVRAQPGLVLRDRQVTRLVAKMRRAMPWLEPSDMVAVRGWARLEVLTTQAYAVLRTVGIMDRDTGEPRRLLKDVRQLIQAQLVYENALGMTPASRQALKASASGMVLDLPGYFATETASNGSDAATPCRGA